MDRKFPVFFAGSPQLFASLQQCRIKDTLLLPNPCVIHQPIQFLPITKKQYLQPIVTIIVLNEAQGDLIIKGNLQLAQPGNTIYVYYPYELQVDEFVYKQANSTYETILKEVPRAMREHFCKYVEWKDGKGDHSIANHVAKLTTLIEKETKIQIQKRVTALLADIALNELEPISYYKIYKQWSSRTKLCILYSHLSLFTLVDPLLQTQYALIKTNISTLSLPPCNIKNSFNPINQQFDSFFIKMERKELDKIQIITQIYLLTLNHLIMTLKLSESLNLMKHLLMFVVEEIFVKNGDISVQICNKLWEIQIVEVTLNELIKQRGLTISGKAELEAQIVQYKIYTRKSMQWIGRVLLGFYPSIYALKPKEEEIKNLLIEVSGKRRTQPPTTPQANIKLLEQLQPQLKSIVSEELKTGLMSFQNFIAMEAHTICKTIGFLKQTKFRRFELHLLAELYLIAINYLELSKESLIEVFKHQRIPAQFSTWTELAFVYKLYFCRTLFKIQQTDLLCQKLLELVDNKILQKTQRTEILSYVNSKIEQEKRYKRVIGLVQKAKVIKNQGNKNIVLVHLKLDWELDCQKLALKFVDSRKKEYISEKADRLELQEGKNQMQIELIVEDGNYLFLRGCSVYVGKVCFELSTHSLKQHRIELETIEILTTWPFGEELIYANIYTPIRYSIKGVEQPQKLVFHWSSQLQLSRIVWVDKHQVVIESLTHIQLSGKSEHIIQIFIAPSSKKGCIYAAIDLRLGNYSLKDDYAIKVKTPLTAQFRLENKFVQYKITNISGYPLHIKTEKGKQYKLEKQEELNAINKKLFIGLTSYSLMEVVLDDLFQQKMQINTNQQKFAIRLETEELKLFQTIRFRSEITGNIRILAREGYEVVGKIKGQVDFRNKQEHILEVGIVPTRTGKIILPDVEIDNKKGEWKHPLILEVKS